MGHYELLLHTNKGCNQMIQGQKNSISHKEPNDFKKKKVHKQANNGGHLTANAR